MFELPEAKRVRRKDLFDSDPASSSSDEEAEGGHDSQAESALRAKLNAQLSGLFDFNFTVEPEAQRQQTDQSQSQSQSQAPDATDKVQKEGEHPEEEAFAFRLFRDEAPTHTVVLPHDDDPAALGEGGFVVPSRPLSYYVSSAPSPAQASEYRSVAVSAEYLFADAKTRRWGLEKPWRVIHISVSPSNKSISGSTQEGHSAGQEKKRKRPGKKHRIVLRVREKAAREREEAMKKLAVEKEQHLQDKKKRLNRDRKLKRRQKEREKKGQAQATNPDGGGAEVDSAKVSDSSSRESSPGNK
ncbi:hypothetical protein HD806DRAFT_491437 [Xylariaceae sp. AK1471]|nr:hypothetical protein HD806DRAFT_491437 [Xylariaceae sp. AK1471]